VVNAGVMNTSKAPRRRQRTVAAERAQILATFECSGLSAAAFTRQHGLNYTTFSGWRRRQAKSPASPAFVQVEVAAPNALTELVVELGVPARMHIKGAHQIELAARLLRELNPAAAC